MSIKADLASLEPQNEFTRRDFVVTMLLAHGILRNGTQVAATLHLHPQSAEAL